VTTRLVIILLQVRSHGHLDRVEHQVDFASSRDQSGQNGLASMTTTRKLSCISMRKSHNDASYIRKQVVSLIKETEKLIGPNVLCLLVENNLVDTHLIDRHMVYRNFVDRHLVNRHFG
jgi:hypothetical protein